MNNDEFLRIAALFIIGFGALLVINVCLVVWVVNYTRRQRRVRSRPDDDAGPPFANELELEDALDWAENNPNPNGSVVMLVIPPVTEDPVPNFGDQRTVRRSIDRARAFMEESEKAWDNNEDGFEAERLAKLAFAEVDKNAKRDHWYAPRILHWLAWLQMQRGMVAYQDAMENWELATQIALEWHEQCSDLLPHMRTCMNWVESQYPSGRSCED